MMYLAALFLIVIMAASCTGSESEATVSIAVVEEAFITRPESLSNMDSPAL